MADLEGAEGFVARLKTTYNAIVSESARALYGAACLTYRLGIPLKASLAERISGVPLRRLSEFVEGELAGVVRLDGQGFRPRHRVTAALVTQEVLTPDRRFTLSLEIARALAPHIDLQAIRSSTRDYRLSRQLLQHENVRRSVGAVRSREWYDNLLQEYGWNGRYWDQRALLESRLGDHRTARSYAERSVDTHAHPFAFNTLGTILLRIAVADGDASALSEGIVNLQRARDWGEGRRAWLPTEHPFVTFFSLVVRFAEQHGLDATPEPVRAAWPQWRHKASESSYFNSDQGQHQLQDWQRQWLMLATK